MLSQDGKKQVILLPIMAVLSTTFFVLRLVRKRKTIGLDDWLLCLAMVFLYADVAMGILSKINVLVCTIVWCLITKRQWQSKGARGYRWIP